MRVFKFRMARKLCQMPIDIAASMTNISVQDLADIEREYIQPTKEQASRLWDFYEFNEMPPRFQGEHRTVASLKQEWQEAPPMATSDKPTGNGSLQKQHRRLQC